MLYAYYQSYSFQANTIPAFFRQATSSLAVVTETPTPVKIDMKPDSESGEAAIRAHTCSIDAPSKEPESRSALIIIITAKAIAAAALSRLPTGKVLFPL